MKVKYEAPRLTEIKLQVTHLFALSTEDQNVYTDDPQDVNDALVKEHTSKNQWASDW